MTIYAITDTKRRTAIAPTYLQTTREHWHCTVVYLFRTGHEVKSWYTGRAETARRGPAQFHGRRNDATSTRDDD